MYDRSYGISGVQMRADIYFKEGFWCVDFIDDNDEMLPSVGMFTSLEDANAAARIWTKGDYENVGIVGKSTR
jgi:hypothetical protein